jgi:hypothetical protein
MSSHTPELLSLMILNLGGPDIQPSDMEWATDLPAGKALLEWFADQVDIEVGGEGRGVDLQACLEMIALEDEEVQK